MSKRLFRKFTILPTTLCIIFPLIIANTPSARAGMDPMVGEVALYAFNFCPRGWAEAQGQLIPVNKNDALFSLFGTTYGGDGKTTFALPKFPKAKEGAPIYCVALYGRYPSLR